MKSIMKFSVDSANAFSFYEVLVNSIIFTLSHRLLYCVYCVFIEGPPLYLLKLTLKIENARNIHISSKVQVNLECKTQHAVITHANTSNSIKIPTFFWKKLGDDVILLQCPVTFFSLPPCNLIYVPFVLQIYWM